LATVIAAHPDLLTLIEAVWTTQGSFAPTALLTAYNWGRISGLIGPIIIPVMAPTARTIIDVAIIFGIAIVLITLIAIAFLAILALIGLVTTVDLVIAGYAAFGDLRPSNGTPMAPPAKRLLFRLC